MEINLKLSKNLFIPKLFPLLEDYSVRWEVYFGSSGSGKSFFIAQKLLYRCLKEKIRVLVCRKTGNTIHNSTYQQFKDVARQWKIEPYLKFRETDYSISFPNGSEIIEVGLDQESKLLSLTNISACWIEEATEVEKGIVEQLSLRMRGDAKDQQIILSFNPESEEHWLYDFCMVNQPESFRITHINYQDNPFLKEDYIRAIEDIKDRDPLRWMIYGLGIWGKNPEGLVFRNWEVKEFDPVGLMKQGCEPKAGADLGWLDPSTCILSLYDEANKTIYVVKECYGSGWQLDEFADHIRRMGIPKHLPIYFDNADPRAVDFMRKEGFNAKPCLKGKDSVKSRILFLQNHHIVISPECVHTKEDFANLSYIKDKRTDKYTEEMTHEWTHAIDGLGYAYSNIYTTRKMTTLNKSVLGL